MKKQNLFLLSVFLFLSLPACVPVEMTEPTATHIDSELEEELAEQAVATAYAKKTQLASRVSPYVKLSNGKQRYLAFWFTWNGETVLLPLDEFIAPESGLITCRLESGTEIVSGRLYTGLMLEDDKCLKDEQAAENAIPLIKIPQYFKDGIDTQNLNVINLNGRYAEKLADILTIVVENDLLGSGDLTLSIHRTDGPNGIPFGEVSTVPSYTLPEESLQVSFLTDQVGNFEDGRDVVYELEREFTWKIPDGLSDLNLAPGDENWFVLTIREMKAGKNLEEEYQSRAYIQVKGVGTSATPGN